MSPAEVARILAVVAAAYPGFEVDDIKHSVWLGFLGDLDYQVVNEAVKRHVCTSRFPPSIAEIREHAAAVMNPEAITGAEAWGEFIAAIKRYGCNHEREALESLHPDTARVARLMGWYDSCMSENVDVLRGQFLRMFEQLRKRDEYVALLPRRQQGRLQDARVLELAASMGEVIAAADIGETIP